MVELRGGGVEGWWCWGVVVLRGGGVEGWWFEGWWC